ncbi:hypothetical protein BHM03_00020769 [Ensete ventricosum]|nr:hypothetical protein BHM03_00020769 [Ensete ventricosum]
MCVDQSYARHVMVSWSLFLLRVFVPTTSHFILSYTPTHHAFNCSLIYFVQEIIIVESFKLDSIKPGICSLHCLPLRLRGAEGSSPWDIPEQTLFSPPVLLLRRGVTL